MKRSELKKIIKEEIKRVKHLNENINIRKIPFRKLKSAIIEEMLPM
jgi:hypothetical protein